MILPRILVAMGKSKLGGMVMGKSKLGGIVAGIQTSVWEMLTLRYILGI